jgi:hypothetical protein
MWQPVRINTVVTNATITALRLVAVRVATDVMSTSGPLQSQMTADASNTRWMMLGVDPPFTSHITQGKLSDPGSTCCASQKLQRHSVCRSVDGTPGRLRRQQPTTPHECLKDASGLRASCSPDCSHHSHFLQPEYAREQRTRLYRFPTLARALTLWHWHLTLASILVRHFTSCKLYSAEVLLSTGGTAMRLISIWYCIANGSCFP